MNVIENFDNNDNGSGFGDTNGVAAKSEGSNAGGELLRGRLLTHGSENRLAAALKAKENGIADMMPRCRLLVQRTKQRAEAEANDTALALDAIQASLNLAALLQAQGANLDEAEERLRQGATDRARLLGANHELTLQTRCNLARLLMRTERAGEAETIWCIVETTHQHVLGQHHPQTIEARYQRAACVHAQDDHLRAEPLYQTAAERFEQALGATHARTLACRTDWAVCCLERGSLQRAEALLRHTSHQYAQTLGPEHPITLGTTLHFAKCLVMRLDQENKCKGGKGGELKQGVNVEDGRMGKDIDDDSDEVEPILKRGLELSLLNLGVDHPITQQFQQQQQLLLQQDRGRLMQALQLSSDNDESGNDVSFSLSSTAVFVSVDEGTKPAAACCSGQKRRAAEAGVPRGGPTKRATAESQTPSFPAELVPRTMSDPSPMLGDAVPASEVVARKHAPAADCVDNPSSMSNFELWVARNGGSTTLEQELELAAQLWEAAHTNMVVSKEDHNTTAAMTMTATATFPAAASVQALELTPIDQESLVSWKGLQLGWILNVLCQTPFLQILSEFGCPVWFVRRVGMIVLIRQAYCSQQQQHKNHISGPPILSGSFLDFTDTVIQGLGLEGDAKDVTNDQPTVFISHTGSYTLQQTIGVLQQLDPNEYVWMDLFCANQFAWTGKSSSPELRQFKGGLLDELRCQISSIHKTVLVLEKWDNAMKTLEQLWVLWEIFCTAESGADLHVLLPPQQSKDFVENCLESSGKFQGIMASLAAIDARKARAEDDCDRQGIFSRMKEAGFSKVNNLAACAVRNWSQQKGKLYLATRRGILGGPSAVLLNNLASLLQEQGRMDEAEPLCREALEKHQMSLGEHHPHTLVSVNNLASLLRDQGKLDEAEAMYREVLEKRTKVLGPDHPCTLISMNNLACLFENQGQLEEAARWFREVFEKQSKVLGSHHPSTLNSMSNLSRLLESQGLLEEAEPLCREALEQKQKILGLDHPGTLCSLENLAQILRSEGRLKESEPLWRETLQKRQKVFGKDHPETLQTLNNLACLLHDQGKLEDAEQLYREAWGRYQKVLGPEHPEALPSLSNLAGLLQEKGELGEAEAMYHEVLEKRTKVLGPDHPNTLTSINNLAILLKTQGKLDEAEPLHRQALKMRQKLLGPDHPSTLTSINNLAILLEAQGRLEEAEPLLRQALEKHQKVLGPDHPDTLISINNLAASLEAQGRLEEAEPLFRQALEKRQKVLGPDHPCTLNSLEDLSRLLKCKKAADSSQISPLDGTEDVVQRGDHACLATHSLALEKAVVSKFRHPPFDVFLSHTGPQKSAVTAMVDILAKGGFGCFFDQQMTTNQGAPMVQMATALETCRHAVVVLSKAFLQKKHPCSELCYVLERMKWLGDQHKSWMSVRVVLYDLTLEDYKEEQRSSLRSDLLPPLPDLSPDVVMTKWEAGMTWPRLCHELKGDLIEHDNACAVELWSKFLEEWDANKFPRALDIYKEPPSLSGAQRIE